jgi:hypothetical protein
MRKPVLFAFIAAIVVLFAAGALFFQKYRQASSDYQAMKTMESETRSRYGDAINEIVMIQDSLNAIVLGDSAAQMLPEDLQAERRLMETRGDMALARIAVLKAGIERTKQRIQDLDESLKNSGVQVAGLERMVANLRRSVTRKEAEVAQLTGQVSALQTQVTGLTTEAAMRQDSLAAQAEMLERRRRELNTIYYVVGTKKELTSSGVVVATGGILGLGKTLEPSGSFDTNMFTPMDLDRQRVIRIPSSRAKVISAQPLTSYALQPVEGGIELVILNPEEFRHVKHLLIMTS